MDRRDFDRAMNRIFKTLFEQIQFVQHSLDIYCRQDRRECSPWVRRMRCDQIDVGGEEE